MAYKELAVALGMIAATSPVSAASSKPTPPAIAPTESPDAKYCLRVEPFTGTRLETIQCWTRREWADQGVDVDKEWAKEGVKIIS
jgi:hypothetical protein